MRSPKTTQDAKTTLQNRITSTLNSSQLIGIGPRQDTRVLRDASTSLKTAIVWLAQFGSAAEDRSPINTGLLQLDATPGATIVKRSCNFRNLPVAGFCFSVAKEWDMVRPGIFGTGLLGVLGLVGLAVGQEPRPGAFLA